MFLTFWAIPVLSMADTYPTEQPITENQEEENQSQQDPLENTPTNLGDLPEDFSIFDDRMMIEGYTQKYSDFSKQVIIEMIRDETLAPLRTVAAVRVFRERFSQEVVSRDKRIMEKLLIRRMKRSDSPFVKVEIMHALCQMDRYRFFDSMVPALIQKMDHYNKTLNEIAYEAVTQIVTDGSNRAREARVVFNTLRRILFLSRKRLANITSPDPKLRQKFTLLRWAIKILGNQELKRLPKEVIGLL